MKALYLIRHAKSSWDDIKLADFDRPLNQRGYKNAPFMGMILKEKGICPDLILSSPAKRAITTAEMIAQIIGYSLENIICEEKIYEANPYSLFQLIKNQEDKYSEIILVGHNPSLTVLANEVSKEINIDNIPTTGIFTICWQTDTWQDIKLGEAKFLFFEYPKKYKNWH
jgi:phosphohistidine phosphatase